MRVCVCVCVCVRETDRQTDRQTDRDEEGGGRRRMNLFYEGGGLDTMSFYSQPFARLGILLN